MSTDVRRARVTLPLFSLMLLACAHTTPPPANLRALDAALAGSAALRAATPTELAAVESDHAAAARAHQEGDDASAELYAERALARLQGAKLLAERARLELRARDAEPRLARATQELTQLGHQQSMQDTRIRELELRVKIAADTEPRTQVSATESAARQKARQEAAKSLGAEATLLCGAARLLGGKEEEPAKAADFEGAVSARAKCLRALEAARRAGAVGSAKGDALLEQLSKTERFAVQRDERGVVVTLRGTPSAEDLTTLGQSARGLAVQVVVHDAGSSNAAHGKSRGDAVKSALVSAGADANRTVVEWAGSALPVVDPAAAALRANNERIDVVYVL